jgi:hypothetical protein
VTNFIRLVAAARLGVEFAGQGLQDDPRSLVALAAGETATMLGLAPKLAWGVAHGNRTNLD